MNVMKNLAAAILAGALYALPAKGQYLNSNQPEVKCPVYSKIVEDSTIYLVSDHDVREAKLFEWAFINGLFVRLTPSDHRPEETPLTKRLRDIAEVVEDEGNSLSNQGYLGHTKEMTFLIDKNNYKVTLFNINEDYPGFDRIKADPHFDMLSIEVTNDRSYLGMSFEGITENITSIAVRDNEDNQVPITTEEDESLIRNKKSEIVGELYDHLINQPEKAKHEKLESILR